MRNIFSSLWRRVAARLSRWRMPRVVSLPPAGPARGRVLLSYITAPFVPGFDASRVFHSNVEETAALARLCREEGFHVDVVNWDEASMPPGPYDLVVDLHDRIPAFRAAWGSGPLYVAYATGCHWRFQNESERRRLDALASRRGVRLSARRTVSPMLSYGAADAVVMVGNGATRGTYEPSSVPVHMVNVSSPGADFPDGKDFLSASRRFIWIGGGGLVHKGLDLVLEAFAGLPEFQLTVFADPAAEPDFARAYRRELYDTPHIRTAGWVNVRGSAFREACSSAAGLVFASCSEGQSAGVAAGLHQGLIPILSPEAGYDVDPAWGFLLESSTVEHLRAAVRRLASLPPDALKSMSRAAWEKARRDHTLDAFEARWKKIMTEELLPMAARKAGS